MRQIFQTLPWIHPAEPERLQQLYREIGTPVRIRKGETLKSGGQSPRLFFLLRGLCAYFIAAEVKGRPSVLALIPPLRTMGDITCLTLDRVNVVSRALQNSWVLEVRPEAFLEAARADPSLLLLTARSIVHKQESHLEGMVANFTLPPAQRLKVFLRVLLAAYRLDVRPGDNVIPLLLSNEQIGTVVNLSRVSVSRIFSQWQAQGLLSKTGRTLTVREALFDDIYDWMASALTRRPGWPLTDSPGGLAIPLRPGH